MEEGDEKGVMRGKSRSKEDQAGGDGGNQDQQIEAEVASRYQTWTYFKELIRFADSLDVRR